MYSLERMLHHFHLPSRGGRKPNGFEALSLNYAISQVASGMIAMFGVLFVYELGEKFDKGLLMVLVFFGIQRVVVGLAVPLVAKFICKTGYRWMMLIGLISLALKAWILMQVGLGNLWLLVPALVLGGVSIASYYQGYYGLFLDDNDDDKIGQQMGLLTMVGRVALVISPLLAGFLVDTYGFSVMFGVAMSLLIVSLTPLFLMEHHEHKRSSFSVKKTVKFILKKNGFAVPAFWWFFENAIQTFFWPIFLFLIVGNHVEFGVIASVAMVVNSLAVYATGRVYDKRPLRRVYPVVTGLVGVSYVLRFVSPTPIFVAGADVMNRFLSPFWWMKIRRQSLLEGERVKPVVFASAWEWVATLGFLAGLLVGYFVLKLTGERWIFMAVPAIVGVVLAGVFARKNEKRA